MSSFAAFELLPSLKATLETLGLRVPTPIQAEALPLLLVGRSVVGVAETGSGKTLTYVLPILDQLKRMEEAGSAVDAPARPRALVVVPNRELGDQVSRVFKAFTHDTRLRVRTALGSSAREMARRNVAGAFEILVATPGRLLQLLAQDSVSLSDVRHLVLDEADQMLDASFRHDAAQIVAACPAHRQMALFSATLPLDSQELIALLFRIPPVLVQTAGSHRVVPTLTTVNRRVIDGRRFALLRTVLAEDLGGRTLLFVNTHEQAVKLMGELTAAGIAHAAYQGGMDRQERRVNLEQFRTGTVGLLIATDLGARGLDVEGVSRVINYHLPAQKESYLHRVGRTARAGRSGVVVNFVTERDEDRVERFEKLRSRR